MRRPHRRRYRITVASRAERGTLVTMPFFVFLLIVMIGFAIYRNVQQTRASQPIVVPAPDRPIPPRHQRVSDAELDERVAQLRQAVSDGSIPLPDAVDSLVRTCGIEAQDAEERLHSA